MGGRDMDGRFSGGSVRGVRRFVVFALATVLATATALAVGMATASAHICPIAAVIPVGQPATIDVGVTVEGDTVSDVEIGIPAGLQLDRVDAKPGWTFTRSGAVVRYRGGPIQQFTCEYFSLGVTAPARGSFGVSVVQRTAAGKIVANAVPDPNSSADRVLDQFVYAGVRPPSPPSTSSGFSGAVIGGIALVGFGVVMFAVLRIRDRRAGDFDDGDTDDSDSDRDTDRDAELQARLERFKKQTPDPRPPR